MEKFNIVTDTASLVVFDLACLKHRLEDSADWWSLPEDEMGEINAGNVIFLNLGSDGCYEIEIYQEGSALNEPEWQSLFIKMPSGELFIGAAEYVTGGDLEPNDTLLESHRAGKILNLPTGNHELKFRRENERIQLAFVPSKAYQNSIAQLVRLE